VQCSLSAEYKTLALDAEKKNQAQGSAGNQPRVREIRRVVAEGKDTY
jgi:hypothetical protein